MRETSDFFHDGAVVVGLWRRSVQDKMSKTLFASACTYPPNPRKHLRNRGAGFARRVLEENMVAVGYLNEEMSLLASLTTTVLMRRRQDGDAVASVAMQKAVAKASLRMAPTVAPTSSAQRHSVPRSTGTPTRPHSAASRKNGNLMPNFW